MGTFASWGILWLITAGTVLPLSYVSVRLALSDHDKTQAKQNPAARHSAAIRSPMRPRG